MQVRWRIELFGGLRAEWDGRVITRFQPRQAGALLAYLAFHLDRSHPREQLIELLWPGCEPTVVRDRLSSALSSLRRQLEPLWAGPVAGTVILANRSDVRLNPAAVTTDVGAFQAALLSAARAGSGIEQEQLLAQAVERYPGGLLDRPSDPQVLSRPLPLPLTRFFGREAEIARLRKLLLAEGVRLATRTGPGGSGKTRLALEAAARLREALDGAVWFVPLADLSDPRRIVNAIHAALVLPRLAPTAPLEQVVEALSPRPSRLVLDNFEQLMPEGCPVVRDLLERVAMLQCLVTSRQILELTPEREIAVGPLPVPGVQAFRRSGGAGRSPEGPNA